VADGRGRPPGAEGLRRAHPRRPGPPVERVHAQFIDKGGRFYVCPICFNERQLDQHDLVESAELQGATPLMEFAGDGATTFSY
jgi:predicted peroxiredoxin